MYGVRDKETEGPWLRFKTGNYRGDFFSPPPSPQKNQSVANVGVEFVKGANDRNEFFENKKKKTSYV